MMYKNIQNINFDYRQILISTVVCIAYYIHHIQENTRTKQALASICSRMNSPSLEDTTILPSIMQLPRDNTQILKS